VTAVRKAPAGRPFWTVRRRDQLAGYAFVAPQLVGTALFVLGPLVLVVWYSLHEWNVLADTFTFVGTDNYQALVDDPNLPAVLAPRHCSRSASWP
jgi:multiple sugar transport system permease protein